MQATVTVVPGGSTGETGSCCMLSAAVGTQLRVHTPLTTHTHASVLHTNPNTHVEYKKGRRLVLSDIHGAEISLVVLWEKVTVDLMPLVDKSGHL